VTGVRAEPTGCCFFIPGLCAKVVGATSSEGALKLTYNFIVVDRIHPTHARAARSGILLQTQRGLCHCVCWSQQRAVMKTDEQLAMPFGGMDLDEPTQETRISSGKFRGTSRDLQ